MSILYTNETARGCGYRKGGGLYICAGQPSMPCGKFPIPLAVCPTCHGGVKQSRSWTWFEPAPFFLDLPVNAWSSRCKTGHTPDSPMTGSACGNCPVNDDNVLLSAALRVRAGLLWIGETFYKTPAEFINEGIEKGISRRISALPNDFVVGETRIFFAHPKTVPGWDEEIGEFVDFGKDLGPGMFSSFVATSIDYILTEDERHAYEESEHCETLDQVGDEFGPATRKIVEDLQRKEARGITLVAPTRLDSLNRLVDENGNLEERPLLELALELSEQQQQ